MKKAALILLFLMLTGIPSFADNSERLNIYYNNGITYFKDKKYSSAILEFKKVLRQRPYDKTVQSALSKAYLARAQYYSDTEHSYKKAINDLRSALVYIKYWDSPSLDTDQLAAQKAEETLSYLKRMYAPLKTAEAINTEAKSLRAQGELAAAIYEYTALFKNATFNKNAYAAASDIYKSLNNEKMAIDCIRSAINNGKNDGMLHFKYAVILDEIGNEDAAMDEYSKALQFSNNNKELLDGLQNLWMARSVQNPKDSQALINLGAVLQKKNEFELAKAQYIKARQINQNDPVVLINLASVYTALNDYENAIRIYDEILAKNSADLSARFYKGKLFEKKGDIASAIKQYREILALKKDDPNAQGALNGLLSNLNSDQLAGYLRSEADNNPSSYDAQFKYAFEMHKNKGYAAAVEYYKRAIAIDKTHSEPFINLAQIFIEQEDYSKAKNVIAHGLSLMPNNQNLKELQSTIEKQNLNLLYAQANDLYNKKDFRGALEQYSKIQNQTPEVLTMIANCYYELREGDSAINFYKKVLEIDPKNENSMYMIATLLINSKREDQAVEYLNKILAINPKNVDAKAALAALNEGQEGALLDSAISLYEEKRYQEALDVLNKLGAKNSRNPYAYYYRGVIFDETNRPDEALSQYKQCITADAGFSLGYYMVAVALDTKENYKEAVSYYEKYIQLKGKEGVEDEFSTYAKARVKELKDYLNQK